MAIYKNSRQSTSNFNTNLDNHGITNIFTNTKDFKDVTSYRLMRGVPDFGSLVQFNPYETGYAAFIICQMPKFIEVLAKQNQEYNKLIKNWAHIVEYEFKSFDGIQGIDAETMQLGDDLNSINVISKINQQAANEFTLTYDEKSGSPLTKFAELYLYGIKDPRTQVKHYHGLIEKNLLEPGFENEVFTFLFMTTDNTMRKIEYATLIIGAQLNAANLDMYNYTKGTIDKQSVDVKFNGYQITGTKINEAAQDMLTFLMSTDAGARQIVVNSINYDYTGIDNITKTLSNYVGGPDSILRSNNKTAKSVYSSLSNKYTQYTTDSFYNNTEIERNY